MPENPIRDLTSEEIDDFRRDGVVCLRQVIPTQWIDRTASAIDRTVARGTNIERYKDLEARGFSGDVFMWLNDEDYRALVFDSPHARVAKRVMGSDGVTFFYDQLFVKEPGSDVPTPWHHDLPFWPCDGSQICSIWMPCDEVDTESSGLEYVRGSHQWNSRFRPIGVGYLTYDRFDDVDFDEIPDIDARRDDFDIVHWDMCPGDVLVFHPLTLHGATGNRSTTRRRRAIATRWFGDDVVYRDQATPMVFPPGSSEQVPGLPFHGPTFPRVIEPKAGAA